MTVLRRTFLSLTSLVPLAVALPREQPLAVASSSVPATFPAHEPEVAREMVGVSHGNVARVRELLKSRPALANASWDWGYGDWESALGAASHVGNQEIARLLLAAGARPSIFSAAMLGHLETVKAFIVASPGIQKTRGPHGLTLLSHARAGGAGADEVVKYLEAVGDADLKYTNEPLSEPDGAAIVGIYASSSHATETSSSPSASAVPRFSERVGPPVICSIWAAGFSIHPAPRPFEFDLTPVSVRRRCPSRTARSW